MVKIYFSDSPNILHKKLFLFLLIKHRLKTDKGDITPTPLTDRDILPIRGYLSITKRGFEGSGINS